MQINFKETYATTGKELGLYLVKNPNLVRNDPKVAVLTALQYWKDNDLNKYADTGNYSKLTRMINGGNLDQKSRAAVTKQALNVLRNKGGK